MKKYQNIHATWEIFENRSVKCLGNGPFWVGNRPLFARLFWGTILGHCMLMFLEHFWYSSAFLKEVFLLPTSSSSLTCPEFYVVCNVVGNFFQPERSLQVVPTMSHLMRSGISVCLFVRFAGACVSGVSL